MSQDKLAQRLDSLLSAVSTTLDTSSDVATDAPPPFAGGVPLAHILDLPLAETPEAFRLPPPSEEEAAALERIQSSLFSGFSIADLGSLSGSDTGLDVPSAPAFMAPDGTFGACDDLSEASIESLYSTETYVPYKNEINPGINHVPSGIYCFSSEAEFYPVSGKKGGGCVCSTTSVSASSLGLGEGVLSASVDCLTFPTAYVVAALNAFGLVSGAPSEPCFLCLVANKPFSGLYCVKLSDVTMYHPCFDAPLQVLFKSRNNNIYWFCSQSSLLRTDPVPAVVLSTKTYKAASPATILSEALRIFLPVTVNPLDRTHLDDELAHLASLEQQKQNSLDTINTILSKYSKE